jgi:drug/metabolite transporter (DMT)-like permease
LSLAPAFHAGPKHPGDHESAEAPHADAAAIAHAEEHGAHGDDHHAVKPHRYAGLVSIIGPLVLGLSFVLAWMNFSAMRSAHMEAPFVQRYFSWMPVGNLQIVAATVYGWMLFSDVPSTHTILGAALIAGSGLYTAWREHQLRLERAAASVPAV